MTEKQARNLFDRTVARLHEAGWDVLGIISRSTPGGTETSSRIFIHGSGLEREIQFGHLHRQLGGSACPVVVPPGNPAEPEGGAP